MKTIGIKLADGSFYPILQEKMVSEKKLDLTTANNNQTKVMVDLYRSANCTMEDAEYVDSLQIENLVAHPNGEPDITFTVSLDENNELSAKIVDTETGNQSKTTITLVSRTQEERLVTDEYDISETNEKNDGAKKAGAVAGIGLLAAAAALREKEDKTEVEFTPAADMDFSEPAEEETVDSDFTIEEETFTAEEPVIAEEPVFEEAEVSVEEPVAEPVSEDSFEPESTDLDFNMEETIADTPVMETEENVTAENAAEESIPEEEPAESFDLDLPDFPEDNAFETTTEETTVEEDPFALPEDKLATTVENFSIPEEDSTVAFEDAITDDLPNFDEDFPAIEESDADTFSMDDDFDIPTNEEVSMNNNDFPDDFFDMDEKSYNDDAPAGKGLSFTGLYDKETELGQSSYDEDESKQKTKVPMIICIICAIICIIATLLVLFIIPSKYNLLNKAEKEETVIEAAVLEPEPIVEEEPEPEPEPVPEAKEEEIVVIEKAEEVVPEQPPVAVEKPKDISYKIKWGDTLWDISETYYKNPWRYKYIARFNNIKNPDHIISGTYITIPAE